MLFHLIGKIRHIVYLHFVDGVTLGTHDWICSDIMWFDWQELFKTLLLLKDKALRIYNHPKRHRDVIDQSDQPPTFLPTPPQAFWQLSPQGMWDSELYSLVSQLLKSCPRYRNGDLSYWCGPPWKHFFFHRKCVERMRSSKKDRSWNGCVIRIRWLVYGGPGVPGPPRLFQCCLLIYGLL